MLCLLAPDLFLNREAIISKIHILDSLIINQIAAGEVIEDSSSVVKELVENALDAGSTRLEIETVGGGQGMIVIRDDGSGMSEADMIMSLNRHATSKISTFEDLYSLNTLGFRGEALASIAAISKMTMCSSFDAAGRGCSLTIEGGTVTNIGPCSRTRGTTIEVCSLFYNVPVRRNFQKTELSSRNKLRKLIEIMILGSPGVGWRWISEGREELFIEPNAIFEDRVAYVMGDQFFKDSWNVEASRGALTLSGRLGMPSCHKFNKQSQRWFINGRNVESPLLSRRVCDAFNSFLPPQRYPAFIFNLTLPQGWYDVNVHPQKKDIRIKQEYLVGNFVYETVSNLLLKTSLPLSPSLDAVEHPSDVVERSFIGLDYPLSRVQGINSSYKSGMYKPFVSGSSFSWGDLDRKIDRPEGDCPEPLQTTMPFLGEVSCISKLGQFLVAEDHDGLYLVHKQQARRHILFNFEAETSPTIPQIANQLLLQPVNIDFTQEEEAVLQNNRRMFEALGFSFEQNKGGVHILRGYPDFLDEEEVVEFLKALLNYIFFESTSSEVIDSMVRKLSSVQVLGWSGNDAELLQRLWAIGKPEVAFDGSKIYKKLRESDFSEVFASEHTKNFSFKR